MHLSRINQFSGLILVLSVHLNGCGAAMNDAEMSLEDQAAMADDAPVYEESSEALVLTCTKKFAPVQGQIGLGDPNYGGLLGPGEFEPGPIFVKCAGTSDGNASKQACEKGAGSDKGTWQTAQGTCDCGDSSACQQNMINIGGTCGA